MPKRTLISSVVRKKIYDLTKPAAEDAVYMHNRNPRNLELMKIAYKPDGFHLEHSGKCFWNK